MVLEEIFSAKMINTDLSSEDKDEVLEELVELYAAEHPGTDRNVLISSLMEREEKMTSGIMKHIAIPHARTDVVKGSYGIIGISKKGIDFDSLDGEPVHLFVMLLSSKEDNEHHLRILRRIAYLFENPNFYWDLMEQKTSADVYKTLCHHEENLLLSR